MKWSFVQICSHLETARKNYQCVISRSTSQSNMAALKSLKLKQERRRYLFSLFSILRDALRRLNIYSLRIIGASPGKVCRPICKYRLENIHPRAPCTPMNGCSGCIAINTWSASSHHRANRGNKLSFAWLMAIKYWFVSTSCHINPQPVNNQN